MNSKKKAVFLDRDGTINYDYKYVYYRWSCWSSGIFCNADNINIPIQGGMNPAHLLLEEDKMLKSARNYLEIFRNHNYIFNLGHGVVPETNPERIKKLVDFVKGYK